MAWSLALLVVLLLSTGTIPFSDSDKLHCVQVLMGTSLGVLLPLQLLHQAQVTFLY